MQLTVTGLHGDQSSHLIHIIRDARGDLEHDLPPTIIQPSTPMRTSTDFITPPTPSGNLREDNTAVTAGRRSLYPHPTSSPYPDLIISVASQLYKPTTNTPFVADDRIDPSAELASTTILLWELLLMHWFPESEGFSVVYEEDIPHLSTSRQHPSNRRRTVMSDVQENWNTPSDTLSDERTTITALAVLHHKTSFTAPLVVLHLLPSPPPRYDNNINTCHSLLTRSERSFEAISPYSPFPKILMISAYGPGSGAVAYSTGTRTHTFSYTQTEESLSPPQFHAVLRSTRLTNYEARSLPGGEQVLGWTDVREALGFGPNSEFTTEGAVREMKKLVTKVKSPVKRGTYAETAGSRNSRHRRVSYRF